MGKILLIIIIAIYFAFFSFCVGYIIGFKKSKEIDDKIIDELLRKNI